VVVAMRAREHSDVVRTIVMVSIVSVIALIAMALLPAPTTNGDPRMTPNWWVVLASLLAATVVVQAGAVAVARRGRAALALVVSLLAGWVVVETATDKMWVSATFVTFGIVLIAQQVGRQPSWTLLAQTCVLVVGLAVLRTQTVAEISGDGQPTVWEGLVQGYALVAAATVITWRTWAEDRRLAVLVEVRSSRSRLVEAADSARRALERDLHDGAQQRIVTASLNVATARRLITTNPDRADTVLDAITHDLHQAATQLRDVSHGIYPAELARDGLPAALHALAARAPRPITLDVADLPPQSPDIEAAIYFCCAEAVQNATKHAGPDAHITIGIHRHSSGLAITITDDGTGFDPATTTGHGLTNINDRVGAIGGHLTIQSHPATGTTIHATIPHPTNAPSRVPRLGLGGWQSVVRPFSTA
jgi:signal transduction histidine kinase